MQLEQIRKMYFIGIGGIGMSALARYFHTLGVEVHGYDRTESELTKKLVAEGMQIHYDDDPARIPDNIDLVVFTPAVPKDHRELNYFKERGYPVLKRSEVLGLISRSRRCIAIAGTHGKTTTSSIATHLLRTCGLDITAFLGGISTNLASNFVIGQSEWVLVEADEYDRSFLRLSPDLAVITSMDPDHLDIYGDAGEMENAYRQFGAQAKSGGKVFLADAIEERFKEGFRNREVSLTTYGYPGGIYRSENLQAADGYMWFDFESPKGSLKGLAFPLPGRHNVENATAAIALALELGLPESGIREGLRTFQGIKRRFEFILREPDRVMIDDYAHHPRELEAAIRAAQLLYPGERITGIFQPHLYSRTRDFAAGFAASLDLLDEVVLIPIYPARELPMEGVSSQMILDRMQNPNRRLLQKGELPAFIRKTQPRVLMTLGAGDIDVEIPLLLKSLQAH